MLLVIVKGAVGHKRGNAIIHYYLTTVTFGNNINRFLCMPNTNVLKKLQNLSSSIPSITQMRSVEFNLNFSRTIIVGRVSLDEEGFL
jgi:hypothetical protein